MMSAGSRKEERCVVRIEESQSCAGEGPRRMDAHTFSDVLDLAFVTKGLCKAPLARARGIAVHDVIHAEQVW